MTVRQKWLRISMLLVIVAICFFVLRYFVFLPELERGRFQQAESAVSGVMNELGDRVTVSDQIKTCGKTVEKYGGGSPYCYYEISFAPVTSALSQDSIFDTFDRLMSGTYPYIQSGDNARQYDDDHMRCLLEAPSYRPKTGPKDKYTIRCIDQVTRYVY